MRLWTSLACSVAGVVGIALATGARRPRYSWDGKVVLITGGSRGLGLVLARQLGLEGAKLAILAPDLDELKEARATIHPLAPVCLVPADVTSSSQAEQAVAQVIRDFGRLDVLVNNAGLILSAPFVDTSDEDFEAALGVHFWGTLHMTRAAMPHLERRPGARLVNICSVGGQMGTFAQAGLSNVLTDELRQRGIRVTTVYPGLMRTASPGTSRFTGHVSVERAARYILHGVAHGSAKLVMPLTARHLARSAALPPRQAASVMNVANRLLPSVRSIALALLTVLSWPTAPSAQERRPEITANVAGLTPDDHETLKRLAESRFVVGDVTGALDALNEIDAPRVGSVKVEGLVRSNRRLVNDYLGLQPGELLTPGKLAQVERRIEELPVASSGKVRFDPVGGVATVTPIVFERKPFPSAPMDWLPVGVRAAFLKEVRIDLSDVAGWGEVWQPAYRWDRNRSRALLRFGVPAPGKLPGLLRLETFWDRQTYQSPVVGSEPFRQTRFRAGATMSDWAASWLRVEGGVAVDRFDRGNYVELGGRIDTRAVGNRLAVILAGGRWFSMGQDLPFSDGQLVVTARSTAQLDVPVLTALAGLAVTSEGAPLALWPGASAGQGRGVQLRARQLLRDGIVTGEVFGRQLSFMTLDYVHPIQTTIGPVGLAAFVDSAEARSRLDPTAPSRRHVDVGVGLRMNTSRSGEAVRLDISYGLRDGGKRLSAGYVMPWGDWGAR